MTPGDPAQLPPRIMMSTTESAPRDIYPLFSDIQDDDDLTINWFKIYQLTPARRIYAETLHATTTFSTHNPANAKERADEAEDNRQQKHFKYHPPLQFLNISYFQQYSLQFSAQGYTQIHVTPLTKQISTIHFPHFQSKQMQTRTRRHPRLGGDRAQSAKT